MLMHSRNAAFSDGFTRKDEAIHPNMQPVTPYAPKNNPSVNGRKFFIPANDGNTPVT